VNLQCKRMKGGVNDARGGGRLDRRAGGGLYGVTLLPLLEGSLKTRAGSVFWHVQRPIVAEGSRERGLPVQASGLWNLFGTLTEHES
jgi:hypothetical protein